MRAEIEEEVWASRSNMVEWVVEQDDTPVSSLSGLTRVVITVGPDIVDSDVVGSSVVWWTDSVSAKTLSDGTVYSGDVIRARLGHVSGLDIGEHEQCRLVIYDVSNPSGLVVSDDITITVYEAKY